MKRIIKTSILGSRKTLTISLSLALLSVGGLWPVADSAVLVEPESGGAGVLLGLSVDTGVENVTNRGVGVRVETVQTGTEITWALWWL